MPLRSVAAFLLGIPLVVTLAGTSLRAQPKPDRTLAELMQEQQQRLREIRRQRPYSREKVDAEMARQLEELRVFVEKHAKGRERYDGRFLLVGAYLRARKQDAAKAALLELDPASTPALPLLNGAVWAERLRLSETRSKWIEAAIQKRMSFEERMDVATFLVTQLQDPRGETIFQEATAKAENDEDRARVAWFHARCVREREDLHEGAYEKALRQLAEKYPNTRYGSIAKDRLLAFDFKVGSHPIPFALTSLDGKARKLADYKGKVLLMVFWDAGNSFSCDAVRRVSKVWENHRDKGVELLGISLDKDKAALVEQVAAMKLDWPQVFGGDGYDSEIALRYKVESTPYLLLVGKDGRIAAMNLNPRDDYGARELDTAMKQAAAR